MQVFGEEVDEIDPGGHDRVRKLIDIGRAWAAFDGPQIVGTAATFDHRIGVPGGTTMQVAGLTMVSVRATHRRRGILRGLIGLHFQEAAARNVAASALWASEAGIYQRFGYGAASHCDALEIQRAHTLALPTGTDVVREIDEATARELLPPVYARATADRPGALRRSASWWTHRRFLETPFMRKGASRRRHVIVRRGDETVGYVVYRQRPKWEADVPAGRIEINELFGIDLTAEVALWRHVCAIDLFPTVTWWNAPTDCPLPWLVADPRRCVRRRSDNLWLRIDDISTAFATRGYSSDGQLRFATGGSTWELTASGGTGRCEPTSHAPHIVLHGNALGAMYLGGTSASLLHRAGLVEGPLAAVSLADRLFSSPVAPWCPEIF